MAIITNTFQTFQAKGIKEDLSPLISNIAPTETPFQSNAGKESVKSTFFEWQQDDLASAGANAQIEGDDVSSFDAALPTARIGNYTQIMRKAIVVAGTLDTVDKAGRKSETAYQIAKRAKELKRDAEFVFVGSNQGGSAGTTSTARTTASVLGFIRTNVDMGATGANPAAPNPAPAAGRTDGTQRVFTEAILKNVCQQVWRNGGNLDLLMVGPVNKQRVSGFAGIAQLRKEAVGSKPATIIGAADVYVSDFGELSVVPNRFMRERDALFIDTDMVCVATLRGYKVEDLAKTGDAEKKMLIVEHGLKIVNEKGLGLAADLTTA